MTGAAPVATLIRRAFPVMGTVVSVAVNPGPVPRDAVFVAVARARASMERADQVFSLWKPQSPASRLRRGEVTLGDCPAEMAQVVARCEVARELSGGWFDPWAMPGGFDPTGLVKGWAAMQALARLMDAGVEGAMVAAGGDIACAGRPAPDRPWSFGIQNPFDRDSVLAVVDPPGAVATSGTYERGEHIVDPRSGTRASAVASASVIGPDLDLADALATALVAGGAEALAGVTAAADGYEALMVNPDGTLLASPGFLLRPG